MTPTQESTRKAENRIHAIRRRQLSLALGVGIPYFTAIICMFLAVYLIGAQVASVKLLGFPLHYWLVAVAVYPVTWGIFIWYVGKANRMEDEIEEEVM